MLRENDGSVAMLDADRPFIFRIEKIILRRYRLGGKQKTEEDKKFFPEIFSKHILHFKPQNHFYKSFSNVGRSIFVTVKKE